MTEKQKAKLIEIGQACLDWCNDMGECYFCNYKEGRFPHEKDCPVYEYRLIVD